MSTALSVNVNKIALLRNSREGHYPNVLEFAQQAIDSGAQGITVHPRPDQRHIRPDDVYALSALVADQPKIEFNIEGNPFETADELADLSSSAAIHYPGFMSLIEKTRPHQATLVPDNQAQLTSDHGFDLLADGEKLRPIIQQLQQWNVRVSLFMDPDIKQIEQAKKLGAERIELYTGPYATHFGSEKAAETLSAYRAAALYAHDIGLGINAGHDLNLLNLPEFLAIANIAEVSIGHALTVDALMMGYKNTVTAYSKICELSYTG
jgi:pyridoxine 5-phosphate synthase